MKYKKKKLLERIRAEMTFEELFEVFEKQRQMLGELQQAAPQAYVMVLSFQTLVDDGALTPNYKSGVKKMARIIQELEDTSDFEERLKPNPN